MQEHGEAGGCFFEKAGSEGGPVGPLICQSNGQGMKAIRCRSQMSVKNDATDKDEAGLIAKQIEGV